MRVHYASLAAAILFGIVGQVALKAAADGSATVVAQFLNPLTGIGFTIYIVAALCYIVWQQIGGILLIGSGVLMIHQH